LKVRNVLQVQQGFKQIKEPNRTIYYTCF